MQHSAAMSNVAEGMLYRHHNLGVK